MKLRLKELRVKYGYTRREVCAAVGITEQTLYQYERGAMMPGFDAVVRLADYYGVSTDDLLGRKEATK